MGADEGIFFP
jgi:hypothetical protein